MTDRFDHRTETTAGMALPRWRTPRLEIAELGSATRLDPVPNPPTDGTTYGIPQGMNS